MDELNRREIQEAIVAADDAIVHLRSAREALGSAGRWGLLDMFGGGWISGLVKHSRMSDAENEIENARYALQRFSKELRDVNGYSSIHISEFLTFADFVFDGFLVDFMVQSKISQAKQQCDEAIYRVAAVREELENRLLSA